MSEITPEREAQLFWTELQCQFMDDLDYTFAHEDFDLLRERCLFWAEAMTRVPKEGLDWLDEELKQEQT